jgi:chromosome segregation protein
MYLQRLEIQGFKSFAKRTVFEFPEKSSHDSKAKSITSVVGPNGSGKSNVSDAIRWVLGEQSLKLIRCKKADEVIFGGSEKKARQGFAEVMLTMNNEDRELPIDYSEVVITRRVFRDGENEYSINKNKVRLYDILILLAKANFGQRSYSIVGQGMVDHIINISPFERKEFFDEATGVKQYQIKRDQSVNRLRRSRENLDQTNKIVAELEPRLRLLTRQIKRLERRQEVEKTLRDLQKKYYGHIWKKLMADKTEQSEKFNVRDALKQELESQLNRTQNELAVIAKEESRKDIFNNLQKGYSKLLAEKNEFLKDLAVLNGKMSLEYSKIGKQNLSWLENKKDEISTRLSEIKESLNNLEVKLSEKQQTLAANEKKVHELNDEITVILNNLQQSEEELSRLKNGGRMNANLDAIKAVLRQAKSINGIYGTIADLGTVETKYETALAAAAGNRLNAVVVENDQVAVRCINYLKDNRLGTALFLPLNRLNVFTNATNQKTLSEPGVINFCLNLISFDLKYKKAFQLVFGDTLVVDNVENAKNVSGNCRLITLDGDLIEKNGSMRGGYFKKGGLTWQGLNQDKQLATQEEKLKEIAILKSRLENLTKQKEQLNISVADLRVDIQVSETKQKGLSSDARDLQKEKSNIESEINDNAVDPADQDRFLKNLTSKKQELERQLNELEQKISLSRKRIDGFNLEEERKRVAVFRLQDEMQGYQTKLNELNQIINEINIQLARLETKKEELDKEINQELGTGFNLNEIETEQVLNIDQTWFEISKFKRDLEQIGGIDPEIMAEHKEVAERYQFLTTQATDLEKGLADLEKVVKELDEVIAKQFNESFTKINKSFSKYFLKIFNGGKAKLELIQRETQNQTPGVDSGQASETSVENNNAEALTLNEEPPIEEQSSMLNTGIEIMVAPPNKKISHIAILSGGERTMTSLALICAIIDSNPSPFIVMDEVDAALDESNSQKFSAILQELSYKSQFIVITHNRAIMHVADVLYGVAMADDGISKTLSLNLQEAEKITKKQ